MERHVDRFERKRAIKLKQRRNLWFQTHFYDEEADGVEWSAHQYLFAEKTTSAPPAAPAEPGAAGGMAAAHQPPAVQGDPVQPNVPPAVEVAPPA